jgi:ATP-dependent helicase HrpB
MKKSSLPIDRYTEEILSAAQAHSTLLIKASPGSGKTTRLPWAFCSGAAKKVIVLEPRRLAAKLAAQRIAQEQELTLGNEVGYHFRFERKISAETQLIFYTEGTFLKTLMTNPDLTDVGIVILDEFHERHLETDLALAYLLELQKKTSLKIILMSATLDQKLLDHLPDAKLIEIEAPNFPVQIQYLANVPSVLNLPLENKIRKIFQENRQLKGDALIFVPGMREMLKVQSTLGEEFGEVLLLHADLTPEEQQLALEPNLRRKIILATNIAESSVTIPGITIVIDSGIQREAQINPWNGLKIMKDVPTTQSSSIQRAGRAGRTSEGTCFRLFSEMDFQQRASHTIPEILKTDLLDAYLLQLKLGRPLNWVTTPPLERWSKAQELAHLIGAIENHKLTKLGEEIMKLPFEARLSRVILAAETLTKPEKQKLFSFIATDLEDDKSGRLKQRLEQLPLKSGDQPNWEKALLTGFVDQVARHRKKQQDLIHYSGKSIKLHGSQKDLQDEYCLVLDITQRQEASLVVGIEESWLYDLEPFPFHEEDTLIIEKTMKLKRSLKLGSITLEETSVNLEPDHLKGEVKKRFLELSESVFRQHLQDFKESPLFARLAYWSKSQSKQLKETITAEDYFKYSGTLNWDLIQHFFEDSFLQDITAQELDRVLPQNLHLQDKRLIPIYYPLDADPYIEDHLQYFFGMKTTPTILNGKQALTMKLVGPHKRPIQVTKDLQSFWQKTYQELKKEYQRDYPRHYWPDDPTSAPPVLLKRQLPI